MAKRMKKLYSGMLAFVVTATMFTSLSFDSQAANIGYENVTQQTLDAANKAHSYYNSKRSRI